MAPQTGRASNFATIVSQSWIRSFSGRAAVAVPHRWRNTILHAHCAVGADRARSIGIITLGHYAEPVREWIHRVKYHGNWPLAEALAAKLWQSDSVRELLSQSDCLVPVPLHWSRQIERGFDQSRILAEWLSRQSGLPVIPAVMRRRRTAAQALLPARWCRRDNVRDAFRWLIDGDR